MFPIMKYIAYNPSHETWNNASIDPGGEIASSARPTRVFGALSMSSVPKLELIYSKLEE